MTAARNAWAAFALGAGLLAAALAMVSRETLRLEDSERKMIGEAFERGWSREAMWRMDSALAKILAVEAARSPEQYKSVMEVGTRQEGVIGTDPVAVLSPFLVSPASSDQPPFARIHFLSERTGGISSPEVPGPEVKLPTLPFPGFAARAKRAEEDLARLRTVDADLFTSLPSPPADNVLVSPSPDVDFRQRSSSNFTGQMSAVIANGMQPAEVMDEGAAVFHGVRVGPFESRWFPALDGPGTEPGLIFVRTIVDARGSEFRQGIWVDWPNLRAFLLGEAKDRFPDGVLIPMMESGSHYADRPSHSDRMLATLPARFFSGPVDAYNPFLSDFSARTAIVLAWGAVAAAALLAGLALRGALELGDRRARFASAVTHELRTPLTTFRMYSQMLAGGMVPPGAEKEYLATLQRESERLSRVVESVLLYARLEEGKGGAHRERIGASDLLDRVLPAIENRAAEGGLALAVTRELPPGVALDVDLQAVEQILLNLVDNACKYATAGKGLELDARVEGRRLRASLLDHGPGIPWNKSQEIFEPFRRLSRDEAGAAPGAGLGLAVARGLARALGGDLVLLPRTGPGAAFLLTLPLAA